MRQFVAMLMVALTSSVSAQHKEERAGIANFTRVDAVVACGGATETSALPALKKDGFTSVINLRVADEPSANIDENKAEAAKVGLRYFHLPFQANAPDPALVDRFLATVSDKANQPVYIHCGSANRVAAVWMVKRVLQDGWATDQALTEAKAIGLTSAPLEKFAMDYIARHKK
ncbi:MAG: beta-lactamase hydrolase domain-containing protein [Vicinamibacterales bacterium]